MQYEDFEMNTNQNNSYDPANGMTCMQYRVGMKFYRYNALRSRERDDMHAIQT